MKISFLLLYFFLSALEINSQSIRLRIPGVIETEEVIAFETSDTTTLSSATGISSLTTNFEVVKIKKLQSASTNELFKRSIDGSHLTDVIFDFYDIPGFLIYSIDLKDVIVNHFSFLSPECINCAKLYHQVWFDYGQIEVTDGITGNVLRYNRATKMFY